MEKKFSRGTWEQQMFNEYLMLCQKMWIPEEDDAYWSQLISSVNDFCTRYNCSLSTDLALALMNDIERRAKNVK